MPPKNQQNPYDFIMSSSAKPPRNFNVGNSTGARAAIVAAGIIFLIIIFVVANSFLGKDSKAQVERLTEVAQAQSEIIRVSALAKDQVKDPNTRNFALNTRLSVETSSQQVQKSLAARGIKSKKLNKKLSAGANTKTDATLEEANNNNRFDETFLTIMNKQLSDYQKLIQTAYDSASPNEKKTLTASFDNAKILAVKPPTPSQSSE